VVLIALVLAGCGGATAARPAPRASDRASTDPARLLDAGRFAAAVREPGVVTVNVHVPYEGEMTGTDRFIAYNRIAPRGRGLPSRSTRLAIYCRTGRMSVIAARSLSRLGYRNVVELRGGMQAWERSGRTCARAGNRPADAEGANRAHLGSRVGRARTEAMRRSSGRQKVLRAAAPVRVGA